MTITLGAIITICVTVAVIYGIAAWYHAKTKD